jgi:hypothetical protein
VVQILRVQAVASARLALRVAVWMYLGDGGLCPEKWPGRDQCREFEHWRDRPGAIAPRRSGRSRRVLHGEQHVNFHDRRNELDLHRPSEAMEAPDRRKSSEPI